MFDTKLLITLLLCMLVMVLFTGSYKLFSSRRKAVKPQTPSIQSGDAKNPEEFMLLAADSLRANRFSKARDLARTGLKMNPQDKRTRANLLNIIGNTLAATGATEKAFRHFRDSVRTDATFAFPHGNLGNIYFMRQEYERAEEAFKTALKLNPQYPDAHSNLGILYKSQKKYDLAEQSFSTALELDPQLKVARENLEAIQKLR